MIDFSQAIKFARQSALQVLGAASVSVEEIEREAYNGREVWSITLAFPRALEKLPPIASLTSSPLEYKRFLVDAETGEFVAMKLREPAPR